MVATSLNNQDARQRLRIAEWLTVERAAYAGITMLALGLRLYGLGRSPLGPAEALQALPAWAATAGRSYDLAGVSPLLFTLQRPLFLLFGATDFAARFWPALLGGLAPLLFYVLRDRLTRGGALVAAFLWAISAVAVFTGRLGLSDSLVAPLALGLLAAISVWARRRGRPRSLPGRPRRVCLPGQPRRVSVPRCFGHRPYGGRRSPWGCC